MFQFRCANLSVLQEPLRGYLGRTIRRKIAIAEEQFGLALPRSYHSAEWLTQLWLYVNTLLNSHLCNDAIMGPQVFCNCPVDQAEAQVWFTHTWNTRVIPLLQEMIKNSQGTVSWVDPVEWILSSYPWNISAAIGPNQLQR